MSSISSSSDRFPFGTFPVDEIVRFRYREATTLARDYPLPSARGKRDTPTQWEFLIATKPEDLLPLILEDGGLSSSHLPTAALYDTGSAVAVVQATGGASPSGDVLACAVLRTIVLRDQEALAIGETEQRDVTTGHWLLVFLIRHIEALGETWGYIHGTNALREHLLGALGKAYQGRDLVTTTVAATPVWFPPGVHPPRVSGTTAWRHEGGRGWYRFATTLVMPRAAGCVT